MRIDYEPKLDFDDVLIRPKRSEAPSRASIDLTRKYHFLHSKASWSGVPIIASNMDTIGTMAMAEVLREQEMLTCLHKYYSVESLSAFFGRANNASTTFMTIGIQEEDRVKLQQVMQKTPLSLVCIDAANGYTEYFVDHVKRVRERYPNLTIMAGNVATPEMVQELLISGAADIVKIGIGSGSVCRTRAVTAVGYPQLSAIIECADAAHGLRGHVCADGGCRVPGDVVKALAAGADFVMLGGMLAGHDECEAQWQEHGASKSMKFYGMSSRTAADKYSGGLKNYRAAEGAEIDIPHRGTVKDTLQDITGGLRSACAYVGAEQLKDLSKCTTFVVRRGGLHH